MHVCAGPILLPAAKFGAHLVVRRAGRRHRPRARLHRCKRARARHRAGRTHPYPPALLTQVRMLQTWVTDSFFLNECNVFKIMIKIRIF